MTGSVLLVTVRLPDGRFHGMPEWPPSPFRLFQALIAGGLTGAPREREKQLAPACSWLERLEAPLIVTPPARLGSRANLWVPNNDLDAVGGDPRRVGEIRTSKRVAPRIFEADAPFLYLWPLDGADDHTATIEALAEQLYQFGRGVDMAHATAEILTADEADARLAGHHGAVHRPGRQGWSGAPLRCPTAGSFDSLLRRHRAQRARLRDGHLTQAPPARFRSVAYDALPTRLLFDLMAGEAEPRFAPVPLTRAAELVERVRDRLAWLLERTLANSPLVERMVIGRGAGEADKAARLRIVCLPSIGAPHADRAIRRVLIEVAPDCPIPAREIEWMAGAVHLGANEHGEITEPGQPQLVRATDAGMLRHYGVGADAWGARIWHTVSPVALPVERRRGRLAGGARAAAEARAASAVRRALRHAGVSARVETIRVQREPFERRGERADAFARPARFTARTLHHVEIAFARPLEGPLVLGDGHYVGLGLMAPVSDHWRDVMVFRLVSENVLELAAAPALLQAVRRALMALARDARGRVPRLFSGHEPDGAAARSGRHEHVFLAAHDAAGDGRIDRLIVASPWICDRSQSPRRSDRERFDHVVSALEEVRAGRLGVVGLALLPASQTASDPLLGLARVWESRTPYRPTRHARRRSDLAVTVADDLALECLRRGLPRPEVEVLDIEAGPKGGRIAAWVRLRFAVAVAGPLLLGRDSHVGGGLYLPMH